MDALQGFFDTARHNQAVNAQHFPEPYALASRADALMHNALRQMDHPSTPMVGVMMVRTTFGLKAGIGHALAGQLTECFQVLRGVLETAGYALIIRTDPELELVWAGRHIDADAMKAQKEQFKIGEVRKLIGERDAKLLGWFDIFYQRCIDFGAHPNPNGAFSTISAMGTNNLTTEGLCTIPDNIQHAIKSAAQVGLCAALMFKTIIPGFDEKEIEDLMNRL
jgi:hypothetical protein